MAAIFPILFLILYFFLQPTQVIDDENVTNLDEDKYFVKLMRQWNDSFYK